MRCQYFPHVLLLGVNVEVVNIERQIVFEMEFVVVSDHIVCVIAIGHERGD
jgi:hypothetical protein